MGFVVDTCIWVDVERGRISPADVRHYTGVHAVYITPVTIGELTFGLEMATTEDIRVKRHAALERLKRKPLLAIDEATGEVFGRLAAHLRRAHSSHQHRVQDLWLASVAMQYSYSLLTRNVRDFSDIPGLELVEYGA
jgi:predicted nucleic acid-binding protein